MLVLSVWLANRSRSKAERELREARRRGYLETIWSKIRKEDGVLRFAQ
jgi:hypothetical protein